MARKPRQPGGRSPTFDEIAEIIARVAEAYAVTANIHPNTSARLHRFTTRLVYQADEASSEEISQCLRDVCRLLSEHDPKPGHEQNGDGNGGDG